MKKIFAISLALLACLCGCQKYPKDGGTVRFSTATYSLQTKAEEVIVDFPTETAIGAYAWKSTGAWADETSPAIFMTNVEAGYNGTSEVWEPATTYKWPKSANLHFFCYSPYKGTSPFTCSKTALGVSSYTIPSGAGEDLCYSDLTLNQTRTGETPAPADILMRHALCKVSFSVEAAEIPSWCYIDSYDVKDFTITFSNILNQGTFSATAAAGGKWDSPAWSSQTGAAGYTFDSSHNGFILMPQTLTNTGSGDQEFRVQCTATVTLRYADTGDLAEPMDITIDETHPLYTDSCTAWGVNQHIRYNLTLNLFDGDMTFSPTLADWEDTSATIKIGYEDPLI